MEQKKLVNELVDRLKYTSSRAAKRREKLYRERDDKCGYSNNKIIGNKEFRQLFALKRFLSENEQMTHEELKNLLKQKHFKFSFLRKFIEEIPNYKQILLTRGAPAAANAYFMSKVNKMNIVESID